MSTCILIFIMVVGSSWTLLTIDKFTKEAVPLQLWNDGITDTMPAIKSMVQCAGLCLGRSLESCNAFSFDSNQGCIMARLGFVLPEIPPGMPSAVCYQSNLFFINILKHFKVGGGEVISTTKFIMLFIKYLRSGRGCLLVGL